MQVVFAGRIATFRVGPSGCCAGVKRKVDGIPNGAGRGRTWKTENLNFREPERAPCQFPSSPAFRQPHDTFSPPVAHPRLHVGLRWPERVPGGRCRGQFAGDTAPVRAHSFPTHSLQLHRRGTSNPDRPANSCKPYLQQYCGALRWSLPVAVPGSGGHRCLTAQLSSK